MKPECKFNEITDYNDVESQQETKECLSLTELHNFTEINQHLVEKRELEKYILQFGITLFVVFCILPILICDLYFGLTDTSCSNKQPDGLAISLKLYLLVSGFMSLASATLLLLGAYFIEKLNKIDDKNVWFICCGGISIMLLSLFAVVWNILGTIVFWGYIYRNGNCNKSFSTYVFVSLILKLIATLAGLLSNNKKNKK